MREAGFPGVHVHVDHARQHQLAGGVDDLAASTAVSGTTMPAIFSPLISRSAATFPCGGRRSRR